MDIKITIKGLLKVLEALPAEQRKAIQDFKYPDPEGQAQGKYYRDALRAIRAHHAAPDAGHLSRAAAALRADLPHAKASVRPRLKHNIRAIEAYETLFAPRRFLVQPEQRLALRHGEVDVRVTPDLRVLRAPG